MHGIIGMVSHRLTTFSVHFLETQFKLLAAQLNALRSTECSKIILLLW